MKIGKRGVLPSGPTHVFRGQASIFRKSLPRHPQPDVAFSDGTGGRVDLHPLYHAIVAQDRLYRAAGPAPCAAHSFTELADEAQFLQSVLSPGVGEFQGIFVFELLKNKINY